ncbi:hypothetical protein B296_00029586, partial [Ensete ventricosum]
PHALCAVFLSSLICRRHLCCCPISLAPATSQRRLCCCPIFPTPHHRPAPPQPLPSSSATSSASRYAAVFFTGSNISRTHRRRSRSQQFPSRRAPVPQRSLLPTTPSPPAHSSAASSSCCCCALVPLPIAAAAPICSLQPHPAGHLFHLSSFPCISTTPLPTAGPPLPPSLVARTSRAHRSQPRAPLPHPTVLPSSPAALARPRCSPTAATLVGPRCLSFPLRRSSHLHNRCPSLRAKLMPLQPKLMPIDLKSSSMKLEEADQRVPTKLNMVKVSKGADPKSMTTGRTQDTHA